MENFDVTYVFDLFISMITYAITWAHMHSVTVHDYTFTFFDLFMGTATLSLILSYIPGFEDTGETIADEEDDSSIDMDEVEEIWKGDF